MKPLPMVFGMILMLAAISPACSSSEFAGGSGNSSNLSKRNKGGTAGGSSGNTTGGTTGGTTVGTTSGTTQGGLGSDDGGSAAIIPKKCETGSIVFVGGTNRCPANSAAYALDDASGPVLACCPLPATDILISAQPVPRGECAADEIAVGAQDPALLCAKINTARYRLGTQSPNCYLGDGAFGGGGSARCGAPSATVTAMTSAFGTDACVPQPFGSLVTKRTGKKCSDTAGRQLFFNTGAPVPMFKE